MEIATRRVGLRGVAAAFALLAAALTGPASRAADAGEPASARQILEATGVKGGLIVHVGCRDGKLTAALRASESYNEEQNREDAEHKRQNGEAPP